MVVGLLMANARKPSLVCLSRRWQTLSQLPLNDNSTTTSVNSVQRTRRDRLPYADELDAPADFLLNRSLIILYIMDQQKRSDGVAQLWRNSSLFGISHLRRSSGLKKRIICSTNTPTLPGVPLHLPQQRVPVDFRRALILTPKR